MSKEAKDTKRRTKPTPQISRPTQPAEASPRSDSSRPTDDTLLTAASREDFKVELISSMTRIFKQPEPRRVQHNRKDRKTANFSPFCLSGQNGSFRWLYTLLSDRNSAIRPSQTARIPGVCEGRIALLLYTVNGLPRRLTFPLHQGSARRFLQQGKKNIRCYRFYRF